MVKKTKIVDVKQKLHHPVQPKKKSHIGEYFGEFFIVLLFFASIAITMYKYTGKGNFTKRDITDLISIEMDGIVGFNDSSPTNPLDIKSNNNNIFDISSYSTTDPTTIDFKTNATTSKDDILGEVKVNNYPIVSFIQEDGEFNSLSGKIEFLGNSKLDQYGRFKSPSIMPSMASGTVFCAGINITGSPDPSLIIQELTQYKGGLTGYLTSSGGIVEKNGGLEDLLVLDTVKESNGVFPIMLPAFLNVAGMLLNSTSYFSFPFSSTENGAIVLPSPSSAKDGDFINLICNAGSPVDSRLDFLSLSIRSVDEKPFAKNCVLFNKNLQLGLAIQMGNSGLWSLSSNTNQFYYSDNVFTNTNSNPIYQCSGNIPDVIVTNGSSNIIFLMVARRNNYSFNSSADGTSIKFVKIGGTGDSAQWAIEGTTYANSAFFLQKTVN